MKNKILVLLSIVVVFSVICYLGYYQMHSENFSNYIEEKIMLPEENLKITEVREVDNELSLTAYNMENEVFVYRYLSKEKKWEKKINLRIDEKKSIQKIFYIGKDELLILFDNSEGNRTLGKKIKNYCYVNMSTKKIIERYVNLETYNIEKIHSMSKDKKHLFLVDKDKNIYEIDKYYGNIINIYKNDSQDYIYDLIEENNFLIVYTNKGILKYSMEDASLSKYNKKLEALESKKISTKNGVNQRLVISNSKNKIIILNDFGLYELNLKENKMIDKKLDPGLFLFGNNLNKLISISSLNNDYYVVIENQEGRDSLIKYKFNTIKRRVKEDSLSIYSLNDDIMIRNMIGMFRNKNDKLKVEYIVEKYDDEESYKIKNISDKLNSKIAPDLIFLDKMPPNITENKKYFSEIDLDLKNKIVEGGVGYRNYKVPISFSLYGFVYSQQKKTTESKNLINFLSDNLESVKINRWYMNGIIRSLICEYISDNKENYNDPEKLKEFLKAVEDIYQKSEYDWSVVYDGEYKINLVDDEISITSAISNAKAQGFNIASAQINSLIDIQSMISFGMGTKFSEMKFIETNNRLVYLPKKEVALSSKSKNKKSARLFIDFLISDGAQFYSTFDGQGLPASKKSFQNMFKENFLNGRGEIGEENKNGEMVYLRLGPLDRNMQDSLVKKVKNMEKIDTYKYLEVADFIEKNINRIEH